MLFRLGKYGVGPKLSVRRLHRWLANITWSQDQLLENLVWDPSGSHLARDRKRLQSLRRSRRTLCGLDQVTRRS